jgi:hypothetical protein
MLVLVIAVDVVAVVFDALEYRLLDRFESGGNVTLREVEASDDHQAAIGFIQFGVYAVTAAFFIAWFHRAYKRTGELGADGLRVGAGWAIGAWFVPILSLWRPKQIANDIWRGSDPELPPHPGAAWHERPVSPLLAVWWAAFLITNYASLAVYDYRGEAGTIAAAKEASVATIGADAFDLVAAALAILVIRAMTRRLREREAVVAREAEPALAL